MLRFVVGLFFALHGLVHLLYLGQSQRLFELQPGMVWPDGSWVFSRILGDGTTRLLAAVFLMLAAVAFVAGGAGLFLKQPRWRPAVVSGATLSAAIFFLSWDAGLNNLADKGLFAILINAAILAAILLFQWPDFGF